jgi:Zn-dependent protease
MMNENVDRSYPDKPELENPKHKNGKLSMTLISLLLFLLSFFLFFETNFVVVIQLVAIVVLHELGHFAMMKWYRYEDVRMLFVPLMGAFVHGRKKKYKQRQSMLVIFAGPIPGIILGTICWLIGTNYEVGWLLDAALFFFVLNCLNLLPLQPMDGGRLISILFFQRFELGQLLFIFGSSLFMIGLGAYYSLYLLIIFGFLMGFQVRNLHRKYLIHKSLKSIDVHFNVNYDDLSNEAYYFIQREVLEFSPNLQRLQELGDPDETAVILAHEVRNVLVPPMELDASLVVIIVAVILWLSALIGPFILIWNTKIESFINGI